MIDIPEGGALRIRNAARRVGLTIYLIGSYAKGTATQNSDFDYIIPNLNSRKWQKIKNSLPGAKCYANGLSNRIDLLKADLDTLIPYIEFIP